MILRKQYRNHAGQPTDFFIIGNYSDKWRVLRGPYGPCVAGPFDKEQEAKDAIEAGIPDAPEPEAA